MTNKEIHVFVDIETNSTNMNAGIWELAYIIANEDMDIIEENSILIKPDINRASVETLDWIQSNKDIAERYVLAQSAGNKLSDELYKLSYTIHKEYKSSISPVTRRVYSWGQFDLPIINYWNNKYNIAPAWTYKDQVDMRSVSLFMNDIGNKAVDKTIKPKNRHKAYDDAFALYSLWKSARIKLFDLDTPIYTATAEDLKSITDSEG
jgi:3' exoribonuclease, RNase T-like